MAERRIYPRFELKVDAKYRVLSSKKVFKFGETRNISADGICFEADRKLETGSQISLEVKLGDNQTPIFLIGEVKWSQELKTKDPEEKRFINGVKLIDIPKSDEGRFLKYYCDRMVEKLAAYLKM